MDSTDQGEMHQANSITLKKMMSKTVTSDTFDPPQHKLPAPIQGSLKLLLEEHESQFTKDETSIGTTPLNKHDNRYGHSQSCFTETLPYCHEAL